MKGAAARRIRRLLLLALPLFALPAQALDYRSVEADSAVFYDGPAASARKLFVVSRFYPVEVVVPLADWIKVRDVTGALAWVEKKNLSERRTVLVTVPVADVRQEASDKAALVFQAEKDVALEVLPDTPAHPGWVKVRHQDGRQGFIKVTEVWGT